MRKPKGNLSGQTGSSPTGSVTARNFLEMATQSIRTRGGEGFVIRSDEAHDRGAATPAEWHAWMQYFEDRGIPLSFARKAGLATVPTRWPEEFDLSAEPSDYYWQFPPRQPVDPYMRARVAELFCGLQRAVEPKRDPLDRRRPPQTRQQAEQAVAAGFPHLQPPVVLSAALRASLGLGEG